MPKVNRSDGTKLPNQYALSAIWRRFPKLASTGSTSAPTPVVGKATVNRLSWETEKL